jgi:hypothetical protein
MIFDISKNSKSSIYVVDACRDCRGDSRSYRAQAMREN